MTEKSSLNPKEKQEMHMILAEKITQIELLTRPIALAHLVSRREYQELIDKFIEVKTLANQCIFMLLSAQYIKEQENDKIKS